MSTSDLGYPTITQDWEIEVVTMTRVPANLKIKLQNSIFIDEAEDGRGFSLSTGPVVQSVQCHIPVHPHTVSGLDVIRNSPHQSSMTRLQVMSSEL